MTPVDLRAWQAHMGLTYDTASVALGVARMTYANWVSGRARIPGALGHACAALAAGMAPWSQ